MSAIHQMQVDLLKNEVFQLLFMMKMMLQILHITNELSLLLKRKDQNVV
jgi:hypothetical protein